MPCLVTVSCLSIFTMLYDTCIQNVNFPSLFIYFWLFIQIVICNIKINLYFIPFKSYWLIYFLLYCINDILKYSLQLFRFKKKSWFTLYIPMLWQIDLTLIFVNYTFLFGLIVYFILFFLYKSKHHEYLIIKLILQAFSTFNFYMINLICIKW